LQAAQRQLPLEGNRKSGLLETDAGTATLAAHAVFDRQMLRDVPCRGAARQPQRIASLQAMNEPWASEWSPKSHALFNDHRSALLRFRSLLREQRNPSTITKITGVGNVSWKIHGFVKHPSHLDAAMFHTIDEKMMLHRVETAAREKIIPRPAARAHRVFRDLFYGRINLSGINIELIEAVIQGRIRVNRLQVFLGEGR
jgi:hypothetical protein